MNTLAVAVAPGFLVLFAVVLRADDAPDAQDSVDPGALFAQLDANKDGLLSGDEIPQEKKGLFDRLVRIADKNSDGKLSGDEFAAGLQPRTAASDPPGRPDRPGAKRDGRPIEKMFRRLDSNHDGKVTLSEVPEERRPMFERLIKRAKKSGDEGLTREEFVAALGDRPEKPKRPEKPGRKPEPARFGPGPRGGLFALLDTDRDHKLSKAEMAAAAEVLGKLDKDGDGTLTIDELMAAGPPRDN